MTTRNHIAHITAGLAAAAIMLSASVAFAQIVQRPGVPDAVTNRQPPATPPAPDPSYIIGPDDILTVNVWNQKEVSGDVLVRPDGMITLPVGKDIQAAGLTIDQLKEKVTAELKRGGFYDDPTVFIIAKAINSRRVYITGSVAKQGAYQLTGPMTVIQLISVAGGLLEFADRKNLRLISGTIKAKDGSPMSWKINYEDALGGKNLTKNNPELRPGDQLIVK